MDPNIFWPALTGFAGAAMTALLGYLIRLQQERRKDMELQAEQRRIEQNQRATLLEITEPAIQGRFAWLEARFDRQESRITELEQEIIVKEKELGALRRENQELKWHMERQDVQAKEAIRKRDERITELEAQLAKLQAKLEKLEKRDTGPLQLGPET